MNTHDSRGMSLIEVMVVVSIIAILAVVVGGTYFESISSQNKVKAAARELVADLQNAQNDAASQGGGTITAAGQLRRRSEFMVFNTANNSYSIWRYEDTSGDNIRTVDEAAVAPVIAANKRLSNGLSFGLTYRTAAGGTATVVNQVNDCLNTTAGAPASPVTFAEQAAPPCNGNKCFEMTANGFLPEGGGILYLSNAKDAFAVQINPAGLIKMCRWSVEDNRWVDAY